MMNNNSQMPPIPSPKKKWSLQRIAITVCIAIGGIAFILAFVYQEEIQKYQEHLAQIEADSLAAKKAKEAKEDSIYAAKQQARRDSIYQAASPEERKILDAQEQRRLEYEKKKKEREKEAEIRKDDLVFNNKFDNSVIQVEQYLQENLNDPDSYESVKWYTVKYNKKERLYYVRHKYRANNSFGAKVLADQEFCLTPKGRVIDVTDY